MRRVIVALWWLGGCTSSAATASPQAVMDAYLTAIARGDGIAAHGLMRHGDDDAADVTAFQQRLSDTRDEQIAIAARIRQTGTPAEPIATVTLDSGDRVQLVLEQGQWRIADGVFDAAALRTPMDAVHTLRRRLMHGALRGLRSLVTTAEQQRWDASVARLLELTADLDSLETDLRGDQATVRGADGLVIQLQRQSGRWRIQNLIEILLSPRP